MDKLYYDNGITLVEVNSAVGGGVTSVALSLPAEFNVSGSPVTTTGTLTAVYANQTANTVFSGPSSGGPATPTFRLLVSNDLPTVPITKGGTGQTTQTNGFDALSPTTTKGDLAAHNGTDNVRLPVGTDTFILSADSAEVTGLKWIANSGSTPTGTANTLAFYNSSGDLDSNANAEFNETTNSMSFGTGPISATGSGSLAFGEHATGTTGEILAQHQGALAHGLIVAGINSDIISGAGSHAFGYINAPTDGHITAGGASGSGDEGSLAFGRVTTNNSANIESVKGSLAFGNTSFGSIQSLGSGGLAFGYTPGTGSIRATSGSFGCLAFGEIAGTGPTIHASGSGSFAGGRVATAGGAGVTASNTSMAFGYATNFNVSATGTGSMAFGYAQTGHITTSGDNSTVRGDQLTSTGTFATSFGLGLTNGTYANFMIGRFATDTGTAGSWVATDSVFQVGNGTSSGSPANAFQIFKDGKLTTTATQKHTAVRMDDGTITVSARTDRTILCDTSTGAVTVNLPTGEAGLEYFILDATSNATVNNITITPNGGDTVSAGMNIMTDDGSRHIQYFSGNWYILAQK